MNRPQYDKSLPITQIWAVGSVLWFEYRCTEDHASSHAKLWYHSHQKCMVISVDFCGHDPKSFARTRRGREGPQDQITYKCRFEDGFEESVCEDELRATKKFFWRPEPPVAR